MAAADIIEWFADEGLRVYGRIVPSRQTWRARRWCSRSRSARWPPSRRGTSRSTRWCARSARRWPPAARSWSRRRRKRRPSPAALIQAFADAGVPPGVLGLVYGNPAEISSYLIPHPVDPQDHLHRLHAGGQAAGRAGRPAHEARDDGAGRPRAGDRLRGRRHRAGRQGRRRAPSSATPARSASRRRASWCTTSVTQRIRRRRWPSTRRA